MLILFSRKIHISITQLHQIHLHTHISITTYVHILTYIPHAGTVILMAAAHSLFPYSAAQWARFMALHCLGAYSVAWVAGITFMLTMTISVLQLREVSVLSVFVCVGGELLRCEMNE